MRKTAVATGLLFSACLMTAHAAAQTSRAEEIEQEKAEKAASTQPDSQEKGEAIIAKIGSLFTG